MIQPSTMRVGVAGALVITVPAFGFPEFDGETFVSPDLAEATAAHVEVRYGYFWRRWEAAIVEQTADRLSAVYRVKAVDFPGPGNYEVRLVVAMPGRDLVQPWTTLRVDD